jgi:hypothetical protein
MVTCKHECITLLHAWKRNHNRARKRSQHGRDMLQFRQRPVAPFTYMVQTVLKTYPAA